MFKLIKWFLILCVVLLIAAIGLLYASVDGIVKNVVQKQGTQQLNVPVTVGGVSLGLLKGTIDLSTLSVGSPAGFEAPSLLSVGGFSVDSGGIANLRHKPIRVSQVRIDQPTLLIEQHDGKINFKQLMDGLPRSADKTPASQSPSDQTKLIIDDMAVNNSHVIIRAGLPGLLKDIDIPLTAVDVKNIGNADGAENGVAIKDVLTTLISEMTRRASESDKLPPEVRVLLAGNLAAVQDKLTTAAQAKLTDLTAKLKIPGQVNDVLNNALNKGNPNGAKSNNTAAQNLVGQGFDIFRKATSKPGK